MTEAVRSIIVDIARCTGCVTCSKACPTKAIVFGDLNDPNSEISRRLGEIQSRQLRADLRLDTGVRYAGI